MSKVDEDGVPYLRSSERNTFMRCPQAWYWSYVEELGPRVEKYKDAADFGTLFHLALANYYLPGGIKQRGPEPAETWEIVAQDQIRNLKVQESVDGEQIATWEDFYILGLDLCIAYMENYRGDPHWEVLDAERKFTVKIPDVRHKPLKSERGRRAYTPITNFIGVFDLCYRDLNDGLVKMTDHKTAAQVSTGHLTLDTQASSYIAVATHALREQGLIGDKEVVRGMEYNFIKRSKLYGSPLKGDYINALSRAGIREAWCDKTATVRPLDKILVSDLKAAATDREIRVTGEQKPLTDLFMRYWVPRTPAERQRTIVRISEEARVMADVREGRLPVLKNTQKDCQFCAFFDLCELDENGGDTEYFKETTLMKRNPYGDHDEKQVKSGSAAQA